MNDPEQYLKAGNGNISKAGSIGIWSSLHKGMAY